MTTYYVGPTSAGAADGSSWANRLGTLNAAEDKPVAAGDTVYVGPGVYRELLTVDVSGTAGNPITYIGDATGEHTDGVGGIVRITGSDNDTTIARANCITASGKNYRTFRGFLCDLTSASQINNGSSCGNWIIEHCSFGDGASAAYNSNTAGNDITIRNCLFYGVRGTQVVLSFGATGTRDNSNILIQNCVFLFSGVGIQSSRIGGIVVKNCTFVGGNRHILISAALTVGQTVTANNCIFSGANYRSLESTTSGELAENYNTFYGNASDRTTTGTGANSVTYPPLLLPPVLLAGIRFPWQCGALSEWSAARALAGTSMATDDAFGMARPTTDSKKSWGAVQYVEPRRDTGTKRTGGASLKLPDAGRHQMFVPTANASTVFSVYVYWGADYTGDLPQLIVKQPGQADTTVTATGSAETWEQLTTTITPAALPGYCVVELVSRNTAAAAAGTATYFDDLTAV